jgi:hypothetical protein
MADISIIDHNGVERFLGNLAPDFEVNSRCQVTIYGDTAESPMFHRDEWPALARSLDEPFLPPVADQDGIGECNCSATCTAIEATRLTQGLEHVQLSAADLYGRINGGSDRGSLLEDGLRESMAVGVAPVSIVPYLDWRGRYSEAAAARKRFRVLKAFLCPTFDHCYSAVAAGFKLISGVMWYSNYKPDGDGWLPERGSGGGGGHAVFGYSPMMRNGKYGIGHQNSWSPQWGLRGRCVFPEAAYGHQIGGWWAVRSVVDEGGVVPSA